MNRCNHPRDILLSAGRAGGRVIVMITLRPVGERLRARHGGGGGASGQRAVRSSSRGSGQAGGRAAWAGGRTFLRRATGRFAGAFLLMLLLLLPYICCWIFIGVDGVGVVWLITSKNVGGAGWQHYLFTWRWWLVWW